ncbi:hypothetical protein [Fodinicola feengrottensis]
MGNEQGQLGLGSTDPRVTAPAAVSGLSALSLLSTGGYAHQMFALAAG